MKKTIAISIFIGCLLYSCSSESSTNNSSEIQTEQQEDQVNIELLSDRDLFLYMEELEKKLIDQESLELSKEYSIKMLESAQKHIEKFPESQYRREAIRKGSRAAQGLQQDFEAIRLIDIAIKENSSDSTVIDEMNVRAYLFDKMDKKDSAQKAYEEIIEKFPHHPSSNMHKERLKTLHLTEEELIKLFEEKNAE